MTAPRKPRISRLRSSHFSGNIAYAPSGGDWAKMETDYGRRLTATARAAIVKSVEAYFRDERFEQNAPYHRDALQSIKSVDKAARSLTSTLLADPRSRTADAAFHGQLAIERFLSSLPLDEQVSLDTIRRHVTALYAAASLAKKEVAKDARRAPKVLSAWQELICSLTQFALAHGMPSSASKGTDKTPSLEPSPFVRMVRALQSTFPPNMQRHNGSYDALAEAISRAKRKTPKNKRKSGKRLR